MRKEISKKVYETYSVSRNPFHKYLWLVMTAVTFLSLISFSSNTFSHSNSVGYRNQSAGVLRFFIGSDHGSAGTSEGYLKLTDPDNNTSYLSFREIGKSGEATASATCNTASGTIACPDSNLIAKAPSDGGNFFVTNTSAALGAYGDASYTCRSFGGNPGISNFWQYVDVDLSIPGDYKVGYVDCNAKPDFDATDSSTYNCRSGTSPDAKWQVPTSGGTVCFGLDMTLGITEADLGIPSLTGASLDPADNATGVSVLKKLKIVFSEAVNVGSGVIKIIKTSTNEIIESINVTSSQVTGSGTDTINATWTNALEGSTDYCVQIENTAFDSVSSGKGFAGISDQTTWNFQTRTLPGISSTSPADDATNVEVDTLLTFNFSNAMTVNSGNLTIVKSIDSTILETIDITSSQVTGSGTTTINIAPSDWFEKNTAYHILLDSGAFKDSTGDPHAGITTTTEFNFTTKEEVPDPFVSDPVVIGIVEAQAELANRAVFGSLVPVASRMMQFRRNRRATNVSHQGIKFKITDPEITKALSYPPIQALMEIEDGFLDRLARGAINPQGDLLGKKWAIWSAGTVIIGKTEATATSSGSEFTTDGITIGVDKKIDDQRLFGMSVRVDQEKNDVGVGSYVNTDSQGLTFYGSWSKSANSFIDAAVGFNELIMDIQRTTSRSNILKGERTGYQFYQTTTLVKEIKLGDTVISPYANLSLGYTRFGSYDEIGDSPNQALSFGAQHITLKKGHIGLQTDTQVKSRFGLMRPFTRVEYGKDKSTGSDITASYVIDPTTEFSTSWKNSQSTGWRFEIGVDLNFKSGFIGISYERIEDTNTTNTDSTKVNADSVQLRALYRF